MKIIRAIVVASLSTILVSGAATIAQANDAHHPGTKAATTKQVFKKRAKTPKTSAIFESRRGQTEAEN